MTALAHFSDRPAAGAVILLLTMAGLAGCASSPRPSPDDNGRVAIPTLGDRIAASALAQLGRPYRFGGNDPAGFDCSGLVQYAHRAVGIDVPRATGDQFRVARRVATGQLVAGDLLFFLFEGDKVSHVAIYAGNGRFVHAPQSGRPVETGRLGDPWFRSRLVGAGRLY